MTTGKTIALTRWPFVGKVMSLLLNMLSRLVITFLGSIKSFHPVEAPTILQEIFSSPSAQVREKEAHLRGCRRSLEASRLTGVNILFFLTGGVCVCVCGTTAFFIYLWLHWVFIVLQELSLVAASNGFSLQRLPCCGAQAPGTQAPVVAACGL